MERSSGGPGPAVDASLRTVKDELKKNVKRMLMDNLRRRNGAIAGTGGGREHDWTDCKVAEYLRERGFQYTLSVLMAEANVPHSQTLKSIAASLHDTRSQLVAGNPELQAAILQIWQEMENRYNEKLKKYVTEWEMKQRVRVKQMEEYLRRRMGEEEEEMTRRVWNRRAEIEAKEKENAEVLRERTEALEERLDEEKGRLLGDAKELEEKRNGLQSLEADFRRQVEIEQSRIERVKANLNELSLELKRQQVQLTFQISDAVKEARKHEQARYADKLQQISRREEKLREIVEKCKARKDEVEALKGMLQEKDYKLSHLQETLLRYKLDLANCRDQLRQKEENLRGISDYDTLKLECSLMKEEMRGTRERLIKEKQQLQKENCELRAKCRELSGRMEEWSPSEENPFKLELGRVKAELEKHKSEWETTESHYQQQLRDQKWRNDQLRGKLDEQTKRLQQLSEMVKKLTSGDGRIRDEGEEEESTPDYLKEAKRRLMMLEKETEGLEDSLRRYQQQTIDTSSMALVAGSYFTHAQTSQPTVTTDGSAGPTQPIQSQPVQSQQTVSAPDNWETKLRQRQEERQQSREEEMRKKKEETSESREKEPVSVEDAPRGESSADPVLQKYMRMVLEQRKQNEVSQVSQSVLEPEMPPNGGASGRPPEDETEAAGTADAEPTSSDSDFDW